MKKIINITLICCILITLALSLIACRELYETDTTTYEFNEYTNQLRVTAVSASTWQTLAVLEDGTLWQWSERTNFSPTLVMDNVIHAVAGSSHSLAITADNVLWAWGSNRYGEIGDGTTERRSYPVRIMDNVIYAAIAPIWSNAHSVPGPRSYAITADGVLWGWGNGGLSQPAAILGDSAEKDRHLPVRIMENVVLVTPTTNGGYATTQDGIKWWWGTRWEWRGVDELEESPFRRPRRFEYKIDENGTLWTWGDNRTGRLGDGTTINREKPVMIMGSIGESR